MKKIAILILIAAIMLCCADASKRQKHLQTVYPKCKVEPAAGIIKEKGYQFIVIDTTGQIIAVDFYPFSESKISSLRNIR
jgi:hypothetical protein